MVLDSPWYQMTPLMAKGTRGAIWPLYKVDTAVPSTFVPAGTLVKAFNDGIVLKPEGGVHSSIRVPPQVESIMPTGVFSVVSSLRPKK